MGSVALFYLFINLLNVTILIKGSWILIETFAFSQLQFVVLVEVCEENARSSEAVTIREPVFGKLLSLGYCTDSRLKHTRSLSLKESYLFRRFNLRAGFWFGTNLGAYENVLRK